MCSGYDRVLFIIVLKKKKSNGASVNLVSFGLVLDWRFEISDCSVEVCLCMFDLVGKLSSSFPIHFIRLWNNKLNHYRTIFIG